MKNKANISKEKVNIERLKKELDIFKKQAKENLAGWQRARADYDNFRKRQTQRTQEIIRFANKELILEILPILDNFELAFKDIPKGQEKTSWVQGMMHIKKQLEDLLKRNGVEEIKALGEKFNPEFHEVVGGKKEEQVNTGDAEKLRMIQKAEKIQEVVRKGYMMNGKVIRVAQVKITNSR